jgi:hypothetical protein
MSSPRRKANRQVIAACLPRNLKWSTISWSCFGMGNKTFLPPCSGAMSARNGFWASGPNSEEM